MRCVDLVVEFFDERGWEFFRADTWADCVLVEFGNCKGRKLFPMVDIYCYDIGSVVVCSSKSNSDCSINGFESRTFRVCEPGFFDEFGEFLGGFLA